jgi:hypothetical protein
MAKYRGWVCPEPPSLAEAKAAGAVAESATEAEWSALSPGMRREVVRSAKRKEV